MAQPVKSNKKSVTLTIGDRDFEFKVGTNDFNRFQNEFTMENKVAPSENFVIRCADEKDHEQLTEYFDQGWAIDIASLLSSEFKTELSISVKK